MRLASNAILCEHVGRSIGGTIVADDHLELAVWQRLRFEGRDQMRKAVGTLIRGNDDGDARSSHDRSGLYRARPAPIDLFDARDH